MLIWMFQRSLGNFLIAKLSAFALAVTFVYIDNVETAESLFVILHALNASDDEVLQASSFRARCRLPVVSWCNPCMCRI